MKTVLTPVKEKWKDEGQALLFVLALWMMIAVFFDFYYDLNDDTAIKDILSGTYTGVSDGHCIQMLYPLGWVIAAFYRMLPAVPWYGLFLCACQFGAVAVALCSISARYENKKKSVLLLLTLAAGGTALYELVFVQYSVTAGLLVTAAVVRLFMGPTASGKDFLKYHSWTALLLVLAFYIRTEMMLLVVPFFALAAVFRMWEDCRSIGHEAPEAGSEKKTIILNYIKAALLVTVLMGIGLGIDMAAYGSGEWREFRSFFNERTTVYDFYGIPDYEAHRDFYESVEMSQAEYALLENYNFDLDEEIDAELMSRIGDYAAANQEIGTLKKLYLSVYTYVYRFLHGQELIFDLLVLVSYFFLIKAVLKKKEAALLGQIVLLFSMRTGLWLFLLYRGRVPERITHPLYFVELTFLGLLFLRNENVLQWKKYEKSAILTMYAILFFCTAVCHIQKVSDEYVRREEVNEQWQMWKTYCKEHPDNFYYLDVYSSVAYSEKLFSDTEAFYRNFDLPGGWCVKSPLTAQKREAAGFVSAAEGLLTGKALFVSDHAKPERAPEFLESWFAEKGHLIDIEETDSCGIFSIYRIKEKEEKS